MIQPYVVTKLRQLASESKAKNITDACILVGPDAAVVLLREMMFGVNIMGVTLTDHPDEVVRVDGIPVVMRFDAPPGHAIVAFRHEFPKKRCCDSTCIQTMLLSLSRGDG